MRNHDTQFLYWGFKITAIVILVIWCIYIIIRHPESGFQEFRASYICQDSSKPNLTYGLEQRNFEDFFEANEKIRARFLKKREQILFKIEGPSDTMLWPATNKYVWHYFPPDFTCPHHIDRIGTPTDGGKWMCGVEIFEENENECIIYSFGVAGESSFEIEMVKRTNCKIFAYDYTVDAMNIGELSSELISRIKFQKIGIGRKNQENNMFRTLKELMEENGHTWIDFLKMDIEGAEFDTFSEMAEQFEYFPFGHLNVEIHITSFASGDAAGEKKEFKRFYDTWNLLESKGLRAFIWEDNMFPCKSGSKPNLMEYGFINCKDKRNKLLWF